MSEKESKPNENSDKEDHDMDVEKINGSSIEKENNESSETEQAVEEEVIEMVEIPKKRLQELETAEERALEEIKLERANSINFRKRIEKQRDDFVEVASARVLGKLLSVKEDIDRVVENGKDEIPEHHYQGISLLQQRIEGIFDQEGVSLIKIEPKVTRYDPIKHEAIMSQPTDEVGPNIILELVNAGFKKGDRVIRAAKVIISKAIPKETDKKNEEEEEVEFNEF